MNVLIILIFGNMIFIISIDMPLYIVFSVRMSIWKILVPCFITQVALQFGKVSPNINSNINMNFHTQGSLHFLYFYTRSNFKQQNNPHNASRHIKCFVTLQEITRFKTSSPKARSILVCHPILELEKIMKQSYSN